MENSRKTWSPFQPLFFILTTLVFTFILARIYRSGLFDFLRCVRISYPEGFEHPYFYTRWINRLLHGIMQLVFSRTGGAGNTVPTGATVFALLMATIIRSVDRLTASLSEITDGRLARRSTDLRQYQSRRLRRLIFSLSKLSPGLISLVFGFAYFHDLVLFKTYIAKLADLVPVAHTLNHCRWWAVTPKLWAIHDTWAGLFLGACGTLIWFLLIRLIWPRARLGDA